MAGTYKGVVQGNVVVLECNTTLPEGTRVTVVPEPTEREQNEGQVLHYYK